MCENSSLYSTGEIAKLCNLSVRALQFYDNKGLLSPSELSEGGRRLYTDKELTKLKLICFLKETGLSINAIKKILEDHHQNKLLHSFLNNKLKEIEEEQKILKNQKEKLISIKKNLKEYDKLDIESLETLKIIYDGKSGHRKLKIKIGLLGLCCDILEVIGILHWIKTGDSLAVLILLPAVLGIGAYMFLEYRKKTVFICNECEKIFTTGFKNTFFSFRSHKTKKLYCPNCKRKVWVIETINQNP